MAESPNSMQWNHPASHIRVITPGNDVLNPRPRGIYIAVSGTITIANADAGSTTAADIVVVAGTTIPIQPWKMTAATDAVVYGLYDS